MKQALPNSERIEVIAISVKGISKKEMTVGQWKKFKGKPGFIYRAYQIGFSQFNTEKK